MDEVRRYKQEGEDACMVSDTLGDWCAHWEYAALLSKYRELEASIPAMKREAFTNGAAYGYTVGGDASFAMEAIDRYPDKEAR